MAAQTQSPGDDDGRDVKEKGGGTVDPSDQAGGEDTTVGQYGADSGFMPKDDREAAVGEDE